MIRYLQLLTIMIILLPNKDSSLLDIHLTGRLLVVAHTDKGKTIRIIVRGLLPLTKGKDMKTKIRKATDDLRSEYKFDYSKAVRGKYYKSLRGKGTNVVMLEPDVAKSFGDSTSVNDALRSLLDLTRATQRLTKHTGGRATTRR